MTGRYLMPHKYHLVLHFWWLHGCCWRILLHLPLHDHLSLSSSADCAFCCSYWKRISMLWRLAWQLPWPWSHLQDQIAIPSQCCETLGASTPRRQVCQRRHPYAPLHQPLSSISCTSEVTLCPLLPWYCVKPSWNIWFSDYQYVFYLEKVIFHLGKDTLNLYHIVSKSLSDLSHFWMASHVPQEMSNSEVFLELIHGISLFLFLYCT